MTADRRELESARRATGGASGLDLRATHRGALILQTENARRMMQRLRSLKSRSEDQGETAEPPGTAAARP